MNSIASRAKGISPSLTLELTARANAMKASGIDIISLGAGEPDFDTPAYICDAAKAAMDSGYTKYTASSGLLPLRQAICSKLKLDNSLTYNPSQIVVANGAKQAIYNALLATINKGDEVIIPSPYWLTYPELVRLCGGEPVFIQTQAKNQFKISVADIKKALSSKTRAIIFNSPSNPTGAVYTLQELEQLSRVIEDAGIYVISDEIYEKLTYGCTHHSIASLSKKLYENTIVINGLSKAYSMTGWRVGYSASSEKLAKAMTIMQSHMTSNVNTIAQHAAIAALTDKKGVQFMSEMVQTFSTRRQLLIDGLGKINSLDIIEPMGAFYIMASIDKLINKTIMGVKILSASDLASVLLEKAYVVAIPCESFGIDNFIRFSYTASEHNIRRALERIKTLLDNID